MSALIRLILCDDSLLRRTAFVTALQVSGRYRVVDHTDLNGVLATR